MEKKLLVEKATEILRPLETANLIETIQNLTLHQIFSNPVILVVIAVVFFLGVIKKSRTVLLTMFTLTGVIVILRYAMPAPGEQLSFREILPFVGGGIVIGLVLIYFSLIKHD